jgi:hypothetical protein
MNRPMVVRSVPKVIRTGNVFVDVMSEFVREYRLDLIRSELVDERIAEDNTARVANAQSVRRWQPWFVWTCQI